MFLTLECEQRICEIQVFLCNCRGYGLEICDHIVVHLLHWDRREYYRIGLSVFVMQFLDDLGLRLRVSDHSFWCEEIGGFFWSCWSPRSSLQSFKALAEKEVVVQYPRWGQAVRSFKSLILIARALSLILEPFWDSSPISPGPLSRHLSPWSTPRIRYCKWQILIQMFQAVSHLISSTQPHCTTYLLFKKRNG